MQRLFFFRTIFNRYYAVDNNSERRKAMIKKLFETIGLVVTAFVLGYWYAKGGNEL